MSLGPGTRLGAYDIRAPLGAGGMGEVYRARDTKLNREVALKVLPDLFASDPDRLARFEREARALAALNHPNIAQIYGLAEGLPEDGARHAPRDAALPARALVMELVEGETLAERIARGAVPADEALLLARQIVAALEAAHEQGIVHRDLKPANIKLTSDGVVKVLDFGLAKLADPAEAGVLAFPGPASGSRPDLTASPTLTSPAMITGAGMLLGTAGYMAPEQARGKAIDKRADIWAFGVVVYEMLTGTRAFDGESVTEVAGAVIHKQIDWSALPATTPPHVRMVVRRCLERDLRQRFRDMGDVRLALDGAFDIPRASTMPAVERKSASRVVEIVAGVVLGALVAGGGVWTFTRAEAPARYPVRLEIPPPVRGGLGPLILLSPDGRSVAFISNDDTATPRLWVHSLESGESRALMSAGAVSTPPFWSPDSRFLAFVSDGRLKRVSIAGGPAETVTDLPPANYLGGTWTRDDTILFASRQGIMEVPAAGGVPAQRTRVDRERGEGLHAFPWMLPDGRHFLYLREFDREGDDGLYIGSRDVEPQEQDSTRLVAAAQGGVYAPSDVPNTGHLLFLRDGLLMAQPFDAGRQRLAGDAIPVVNAQIGTFQIIGSFSASDNGTVAFRRGNWQSGSLVWVGRDGQTQAAIAAQLEEARNPRLSPDGRSVALIVGGDLWRYHLDGRPPVKLTFDGGHFSPVWTPDGRRIAYEAGGDQPLMAVAADGSGGAPEPVAPPGHFHPHAFTPDGRELIATRMPSGQSSGSGSIDLLALAGPDAEPRAIVTSPANEGSASALSPDGRWLAYTSDATGRSEIWVRPFPGSGSAVRVSPNGGTEPVWARNGRELYYLEGQNLMAVAVDTGATFSFSAPAALFTANIITGQQPPSYDVAADGRFMMIRGDSNPDEPISVILNWTELLRQRAR